MRAALTVNANVVVGAPCQFCGVRPDVTCHHRAAVAASPRPELPSDRRERRDYSGTGKNFHGRREVPRGMIGGSKP